MLQGKFLLVEQFKLSSKAKTLKHLDKLVDPAGIGTGGKIKFTGCSSTFGEIIPQSLLPPKQPGTLSGFVYGPIKAPGPKVYPAGLIQVG